MIMGWGDADLLSIAIDNFDQTSLDISLAKVEGKHSRQLLKTDVF